MTQEDKELLLKDLSARIPYGVICKGYICGYPFNGNGRIIGIVRNNIYTTYTEEDGIFDISQIKPYLRPMSSMIEEEKKEFDEITLIHTPWGVQMDRIPKLIDWLSKKMFDYRGLIEKGLAIEAPKDMYKI